MAKQKKVVSSIVPSKRVVDPSVIRSTQPIAWNFKYVERDDKSFKIAVVDWLRLSRQIIDNFEGKTIPEIERSHKSNHNGQDTSKLSSTFKNILKTKHLEQEEIFQLNLNVKTRIWGFIKCSFNQTVRTD